MEQRLANRPEPNDQPDIDMHASASLPGPRPSDIGTAALHGAPFRLGMPHLSAEGVHLSWLLREACHMHWSIVAKRMNISPSAFLDQNGARVLPSVVGCTFNGDATQFHEHDLCQFIVAEMPRPENGWRIHVDLVKQDGRRLSAEIITAFSRRNGPSNLDLKRAELDRSFSTLKTGEAAERTNFIRTHGGVDRASAEQDQDPPHLSVQIDQTTHINGVGLVYFASIHDMIARSEANALPKLIHPGGVRSRRIHYFGNLDAGDFLDITTRALVQSVAPNASIVVRSHARRASDDAVISVAESHYSA
ncbi:MAG: hypothetical protein AAGG69_07290 [Pseudomonadota bacterium]